jgi:hypothetical protein
MSAFNRFPFSVDTRLLMVIYKVYRGSFALTRTFDGQHTWIVVGGINSWVLPPLVCLIYLDTPFTVFLLTLSPSLVEFFVKLLRVYAHGTVQKCYRELFFLPPLVVFESNTRCHRTSRS